MKFLDQLGSLDLIKGVCDADFIYNPKIAEGIANKSILKVGNSNELFTEIILKNKNIDILTFRVNSIYYFPLRDKQASIQLKVQVLHKRSLVAGHSPVDRANWPDLKFRPLPRQLPNPADVPSE